MARSVTLAVLRTRWRQRANLEGATDFIADPEGDDNINEGVAELVDVIRGCYGADYYLKSVTFNTTSGVDTYALAAIGATDFVSLRGVDITQGVNIVLTARPFNFNERNRYKWVSGWVYSEPVFYRIAGNNLVFEPIPTGAYQIKLWYLGTPAKLVNPGDSLDGVMGWEEYVVLYAAIRALLKDGDNEAAGPLVAEKERIRARIESLAGARDANEPERVVDVYAARTGWEDSW